MAGMRYPSRPMERNKRNCVYDEYRLEVIQKLIAVDKSFAKDALNPLFRMWRKIYDSDSIDISEEVAKIGSIHELTVFPKVLFSLIDLVLYSVAYDRCCPSSRKCFRFLLHSILHLCADHRIMNVPHSLLGRKL